MLIKRLVVRKTKPDRDIIRDITFNLKGLNLIVDSTTGLATDTGNSVGKSTTLRVIDLCLAAGSPKILYFDNDTKATNAEVEQFLKQHEVEAELTLVNDTETIVVHLTRPLFPGGRRMINGSAVSKVEYDSFLKDILFGFSEARPTLRQLIPKFVRIDENKPEHLLRYLSHTSKHEYDTIYLFLFRLLDLDLLGKKDALSSELALYEKKIDLYTGDSSIGSLDSLKQRRELVDSELKKQIEKRNQLSYLEAYKEELHLRRDLSVQMGKLEETIEFLQLDLSLLNDGIQELESKKSNIDVEQIRAIYEAANVYIGHLDKSFGEVLEFHNAMIQNKIDFLDSQRSAKEETLKLCLADLEELIDEKAQIVIDLLDEGLLEELNALNNRIEELTLEKGRIFQSIDLLEQADKEKTSIQEKLAEIEKQLDPEAINRKISIFNEIFTDYSTRLYNEQYYLVYDTKWKEIKAGQPVSLKSYSGNVGTGKRKGIMVAFDLAYLKYSINQDISAPLFVIHDKLENTHINQLRTIFELCKSIKGQYIIPILRERVDKVDLELVDDATILELSSTNKFFRI